MPFQVFFSTTHTNFICRFPLPNPTFLKSSCWDSDGVPDGLALAGSPVNADPRRSLYARDVAPHEGLGASDAGLFVAVAGVGYG